MRLWGCKLTVEDPVRVPTDPERDAYLDAILIGGREPANIRLVDYDPRWPDAFAALRDTIRSALGERVRRIEHIGSTSVQGLAAKPIVDLVITLDDVTDEASYVPPMEQAGFVLRVREDDHRMFRTPDRTAHVHVYADTHPAVAAYLELRERLRTDAADRELYERTKRELAKQEWTDMNAYADAKTAVITEILGRAGR